MAPKKKTKKKKATAKVKAKSAPKRAKPAARKKLRAAPKKKKAVAKKAKAVKAVAKAKPKARAKAKPKAVAKPKAKTLQRRDGAGHLDPRYAAELRRLTHRPDHLQKERAFVGGQDDDLAESLGEQVIESATSGEYDGEDVANQNVPEERGGPFVESSGAREFAHDIDESNPADAKREPFPTS